MTHFIFLSTLCLSVVVKREMTAKAKLLIQVLIYAHTFTYGHELWAITERIRSQIQAVDMHFLQRVSQFSFIHRVRSSVIQSVAVLLLHLKESVEVVWGTDQDAFGHLLDEVFQVCSVPEVPELNQDTLEREIKSLGWPQSALLFPQMSWRRWLGKDRCGLLWLGCCS